MKRPVTPLSQWPNLNSGCFNGVFAENEYVPVAIINAICTLHERHVVFHYQIVADVAFRNHTRG